MRIDQGVILIGGRGTRLGPVAETTAKPMLEVAGRPFVEHVIAHLSRFGIRKIILLAGHQGALPQDRYHGRRLFGVALSVLIEPGPLGTAGALRFAAPQLDDRFLLTNGDTFFDADLLPLLGLAQDPKWQAVMALRRIGDASRYGSVIRDAAGAVLAFAEKAPGQTNAEGLINAGAYVMRRDAVLAAIERIPYSLENDLFPRLAAAGVLGGVEADGYFIDIGIPQSLESARLELAGRRTKPAAFLDRDGVLNIDRGYTHRIEQLEWIPGAPEAVRVLNQAGFYVVVATNQAGVARGYYDEAAIQDFHAHMQDRLMADGAHIDAFYYCPHHPEGSVAGFAIACDCRKPMPGLLEQAARDWFIDRPHSFMIGDRDSDMSAAAAFGIRGAKFDADAGSLVDLTLREIAVAGGTKRA